MNPEAFRKSIDELHERLKSLTATKGQEYKGGEETSQFANFERHAASLGMSREQVLFVYMMKHIDSITTYVKDRAAGRERVYAEPITGRIDDAILYMLLLRGMAVENDEAFEVPEFVERAPLALDPGPSPTVGCPTFIISRVQPDAVAECQTRALPVAVSALSTVDQLYGVRPGGHVVFIHHGNGSDDAMLREVEARCTKQGLTHEVVHR